MAELDRDIKFITDTSGRELARHLWFREVRLWEVQPEVWWEKVPGLMVLYPLCRHQGSPREAIRHSAAAIEWLALPAGQRQDWFSWLEIFGGLLLPRRKVNSIIGSEKMKESSVYRGILEDGERTINLRVLRARFGPELPDDLLERLNQLEEPDQLEPLGELAATCAGLEVK
jgi:hypothetical protein